ncbi:hypothetical protein [Tissierella sp.]|uniref:hypothetical protein n=1 Tax=Tissierella sp. TaxID=41274 RepID=UPI00285EE50D|nr:hypothetical protein [Tissierella sp.]MDR7855880.1 hypothetical protein [Tissierella sp.]
MAVKKITTTNCMGIDILQNIELSGTVNRSGITNRLYIIDSPVEIIGEIQSTFLFRKNINRTDVIGKIKKINTCHESINTSCVLII